MIESNREDMPQFSEVENDILNACFTKEEVNKAPGSYGFPAQFYQAFLELVNGGLMALFDEFHKGTLPLFSLNFSNITLVPKQNEAKQIQQFRPIYLLNVGFKIFTKLRSWQIGWL
jgi:hypothetical protein